MFQILKPALLLAFAAVISGCQSPSRAMYAPPAPQPRLPIAPADIMMAREPNFLPRLLKLLQPSPAKPTPSSSS